MGNMSKLLVDKGGSGAMLARSVAQVTVLMGREALLGVARHRMQA